LTFLRENVVILKDLTAWFDKIEVLCQSYALRRKKYVDSKGVNGFVLQNRGHCNFLSITFGVIKRLTGLPPTAQVYSSLW
jgi:hypothetical protein